MARLLPYFTCLHVFSSRRNRSLVLGLIIGLVGSLLVAAPPVHASVALTVGQWDVDPDNGRVSYSLQFEASSLDAPGAPCDDWCSYKIEAAYVDGATTHGLTVLKGGSLGIDTPSFSTDATQTNALLGEVTHVRAFVAPDYTGSGNATQATGWIKVSDPYPTGKVELKVNDWDANEETGKVSYDIDASYAGASQRGGPCQNADCWWSVHAARVDGGVAKNEKTIASNPFYTSVGNYWSNTINYQASGLSWGEVTHVKATLAPMYDSSKETYTTGWIQVSNPFKTGSISIDINDWHKANDRAYWDVDVVIEGAGQVDGPCAGDCQYSLEVRTPNVQVGINSQRWYSGLWSAEFNVQGNAGLNNVIGIRAAVYPVGRSGETWTTPWYEIDDFTADLYQRIPFEVALAGYHALSPATFCDPLLLIGQNTNNNTLLDAYEACYQAILANKPLRIVLRLVAASTAGYAALRVLQSEHVNEGTPHPTPEEEENPPAPWIPEDEDDNGCSDQIFLDSAAYNEIERKHGPNSTLGKSKWLPHEDVNWPWLVQVYARKVPPTESSFPWSNRCERVVVDYPYFVGQLRHSHTLTPIFTVVTERNGHVVNAYPGEPLYD